MNNVENFPQGYWQSADKKFINKYEALLHATQNNLPLPSFKFFDTVWENFDRSLIGTVSLKELYRQRAQQLRDKYDYLILYFSGGADSYNVLRSFIDNNIKIDEICVKWCNDTLTANTTIYTPNTINNTAWNYLSEWDYAIKPVLDEISKSHPEIKIEIVDWFKTKGLIGAEESFKTVNHWHDVEVPSLAVWSPNEEKLVSQGKRVGAIYGIDKPSLYFIDKKVNMFFVDGGVSMGTPNPCNIYGTEYFYWAQEFPILTFEMANQAVIAFKKDKELFEARYRKEIRSSENNGNGSKWDYAFQVQQKRLRHILYDNWTDRFQVLKPQTCNRSDKHSWIYKHHELSNFKDSYSDMVKMHMNQINSEFYLNDPNGAGSLYKFISTKGFSVY
jgi:hypothetical protein